MLANIEVTELQRVGIGLDRPEQVVVTRDGRVYSSDKGSAVAEILPGGGLRRIGRAGGDPNGMALSASGRFLIANFGLGLLQEVDPLTGQIEVLIGGEIAGRSLQWLNFVLVDRAGTIWASVSTVNPDLQHTIGHGTADGFLFRMDPDGSSARVVADGVNFPNCMALDWEGEYLYVVRTTAADVVRFRIDGDKLGGEERFSPPLGDRRPEEYGDDAANLLADPQIGRRWGMADGCAFDERGNLWVTLLMSNRIVAVSPTREVIPVIEDAAGDMINTPTSIAWGGPDLRDVYFGSLAGPFITKGRSSVAGMPMVHQR